MDVKTFYGKRFVSLADASEFISAEDFDNFDIAIIPPSPFCYTDEEEIDEGNLLRDDVVRDVPGELEIFFSSDSEDNLPLAALKKSLLAPLPIKWRRRPMSMEMISTNFYETNHFEMRSALQCKSPIEVFETLFDEQVVKLIVDQSKLYAMQKNQHDFHFDGNDLKVFIGILLYSGYHSMPRENMYWQVDEDTRTPFISNNMSRNRFHEIRRYLHLVDNSALDLTDKVAKVRPLSNMLCKKFCQFGYMHQDLSIDESMVKYFGSHSSKQFISEKPVRFYIYDKFMRCKCLEA